MGLFGKLFEKKECDICGGEIGLLGNKKLEDGNMCKTCARKLSPWFEDRKSSTIAQINEQLAYREANKAAVSAFNTSRVLGRYYKVHIDDTAGKFMVVEDDIQEENPDVIDISAVTGCELDIEERTQEIKQTVDGKPQSYNPPRYKYFYDFKMIILVKHPYFDDMRFRINECSVEINPHGPMGMFTSRSINPRANREYMEYERMGEEIREALLNRRGSAPVVAAVTPIPAQPAAPAAPPRPKFCTNCGAPAESGKFCQNCGSPLG